MKIKKKSLAKTFYGEKEGWGRGKVHNYLLLSKLLVFSILLHENNKACIFKGKNKKGTNLKDSALHDGKGKEKSKSDNLL